MNEKHEYHDLVICTLERFANADLTVDIRDPRDRSYTIIRRTKNTHIYIQYDDSKIYLLNVQQTTVFHHFSLFFSF